jgi:hypothetical protein
MTPALLALLLVLAAPGGGSTDETPVRAEARRLFRAGEQAYYAGRYDVAAKAFDRAYQTLPLPAIAFSLAQAERLQYVVDRDPRRLRRAVELYRAYIEAGSDAPRRADAISLLSQVEILRLKHEPEIKDTKVARPTEDSARTELMVIAPNAGASAAIDDGPAKELPLIAAVEAGVHKVRITAKGFEPLEKRAVALPGRQVVIDCDPKPLPGLLRVRSEEGALVAIDEREVGATPLDRPVEIAGGNHFVTVSLGGREPWGREIALERGAELELSAELEPTTQRRVATWGFAAAGLAAAGAVVFGGLALKAEHDASQILDQRNQHGLTLAQYQEGERLAALRDAHLTRLEAIGGAALGLGAIAALLYWIDRPKPPPPPPRAPVQPTTEEPPLSAAPVLTPDGRAGVAIQLP